MALKSELTRLKTMGRMAAESLVLFTLARLPRSTLQTSSDSGSAGRPLRRRVSGRPNAVAGAHQRSPEDLPDHGTDRLRPQSGPRPLPGVASCEAFEVTRWSFHD
jgi:hypothetical protein